MAPVSSIVMSIQGIISILNGSASLFSSSMAQKNAVVLGVESIPVIHAIALGSISIGTFYLVAAKRQDKLAMCLSVVGRTLAVGVFMRHDGPWKNVAVYEGVCGGLLAASMLWETYVAKDKVI